MDNRENRLLYFAIWARQDVIVSKMKPLDMMEFLTGRRIFSFQERKQIDTEGRVKGDARYNRLILTHLMKKDEVTPGIMKIFVEGLAEKNQSAAQKAIEDRVEELKFGPTDDFFNNLRKLYVDIWTTLSPVPTEQFTLNLVDKRLLVNPDFSAKIKVTGHDGVKEAWVEPEIKTTQYRSFQVGDFENIFKFKHNEKDKQRLVLIKGDPGVGKSTLCRLYSIKWALSRKSNIRTTIVKDSPIARFKVVFYLPLSSFGKHETIIDMLLDTHMKYFEGYDQYMLESYLADITNMNQTLFILDGLDDVTLSDNSEISSLISGHLYPEAKVVVCSRPYRVSLQQIRADPDLIVKIDGIGKNSARKMIHELFNSEMSPDRCEMLDKKCLQLNTDLQLNPLCLNLICFIFQNHMRLGKLPEDFTLPQTRTRLFNAYFKMLLRLHLKKWSRSNEECFFIKNPLSQDAAIPSDLKHIIYVMSRLSFLALANEKYDFTEEELQVNLLNSKTLKDIGLVCDIDSTGLKRFFFRHKMLAEHLAGIYLSMEGSRVPEYTKRLEEGDKRLLSDRLGTFHNMVAFACGVSSVFFKELCKSATEHCFIKGMPDKDTFLYPADAVLFLETQDQTMAEVFAKYLLDTELVKGTADLDIEPSVYEWSAALYFVDHTGFSTIVDIFERFYHLKLYPREMRDDETESKYEECVRIETVQKRIRGKYRNHEAIDFQQCGLLFSAASSLMIFQNIKNIIIDDGMDGHSSAFLQLRDVVYSFPNVEEVELRKVNLYSTEHRIGFHRDIAPAAVGDLDTITEEDEEEQYMHPMKTVCFDQIDPNESVVRDIGVLQNIETIQVLGSQMHESGLATLAAAIKATPHMTCLALSGNHLGLNAISLLQALSVQPEIRELYLSNCALKEASEPLKTRMASGTIDQIKSLQKLDISENELTHRQFAVLDYFTTGNLRVLKLSGNQFGAAAVQVLNNLAEHDTIADLHMDDCALDSAVEPLQEALKKRSVRKMHNITKLHLKNNWLEEGIHDIMGYFFTNKITVLHLSGNPLGEAAVDLFYKLAEMGTVVELYLDNCNLDDAVLPLEEATASDCDNILPPLNTVQILNISDNGLKSDSGPLLSYVVTKKLKVLDVSVNPLGAATVFLLDRLAKFDAMRDLSLKNCDLQSAVEPLHEAIDENTIQRLHRLKLVNISGNFLEYLSKGLPSKTFEQYFSTSEKLKMIRR